MSRPKRRSYVTLPLGIRVVRRELCRGIGITSFCLLLLAGIGLYINYELRNEASSAVNEKSDAVAEGVSAEKRSLEFVLDRFNAVAGLKDAEGLMLHGFYTEDGRKFAMKLAEKPPYYARKTLEDNDLRVTCLYDGVDAFVEIEDRERGQVEAPMDDKLYRMSVILESSFLALASSGFDSVYSYRLGLNQQYAGKEVWAIESRLEGQPEITHLIDVESGLELVRFGSVQESGKKVQISMHLSDHRSVDGGVFPFRYELKINGRLRGGAEIEKVIYDPGLPSWIFTAKEAQD